MRATINTRTDGLKTFWANEKDGFSYVYLEDKGIGTTGSQICEGGGFTGNTIMCRGNQESLEKAARKWWKQRQALMRKAAEY